MAQLKEAKKSAESLTAEAQIEINNAKAVQKDCIAVAEFANKVIKL